MTLKLINIQKQFGKHIVIEGFNYEFEPGKRYVIRGKSGSGKSTLLNLIARFDQVNHGVIEYDGQNIDAIPKTIYFRDILGYLFQNYALLESETVAKNLKVAFQGRISKDDQRSQMEEALQAVKLPKYYLFRPVYELSGGEQQRVAIARMLIKRPKILLVDEPTAALDDTTAKAILNDVLGPVVTSETIMLVASHDPLVFEWADEAIEI